MDKDRDKDKKASRQTTMSSDAQPDRGTEASTGIDEFFRGLGPDMRHPKPSADAVAAAMEAAQRLAAEADVEAAVGDVAQEIAADSSAVCRACGHRNRPGNRFCAMCGTACATAFAAPTGTAVVAGPAGNAGRASSNALIPPSAFLDEPEVHPAANRPTGQETHHYHHHYHHHYFPGGYDGGAPRYDSGRADSGRDSGRESGREDKLRTSAALRGDMTRAEAAVRLITQEWVMACNTKHLDDLLDLYVPDALVLRSNYPPVRGAAAIREFFFGVLNAGLGEVEVEPLRLEVAGDMAFEAGRCKALVPSAAGKRREERGKYLWVFARQSGEWKLAADCWSSDLTLSMLESDIPAGAAVRTAHPRKTS